jgi:hypothetical protein
MLRIILGVMLLTTGSGARQRPVGEPARLSALATFRRKIDVFGSTFNGLRPSKDRRAAGGLF